MLRCRSSTTILTPSPHPQSSYPPPIQTALLLTKASAFVVRPSAAVSHPLHAPTNGDIHRSSPTTPTRGVSGRRTRYGAFVGAGGGDGSGSYLGGVGERRCRRPLSLSMGTDVEAGAGRGRREEGREEGGLRLFNTEGRTKKRFRPQDKK